MDEKILLKKYSNRRLYDTRKSRYVTLEDLTGEVGAEEDRTGQREDVPVFGSLEQPLGQERIDDQQPAHQRRDQVGRSEFCSHQVSHEDRPHADIAQPVQPTRQSYANELLQPRPRRAPSRGHPSSI